MAESGAVVVDLQQRLAGLRARLQRWRRGGRSDDAFLIRASATLESLTDLSKEPRENNALPKFIQLYTQTVLDITYFEENQLVDEDFPEESSLQKVQELINVLSEPELLVNETSTSQEPLSVLGTELLECLYWRRGALLYMFCHTVKGRKEWLTEKIDILKKFLNEGIHYLVTMLGFRCIYSDTHLLAMMYCGEMCYWGLKYCGEEKEQIQSTDLKSKGKPPSILYGPTLDFRETGERMLQKYITVCEGPLRLHDWDTKNAKRILDYFQHLSA
ncbi:hypothetical protein JD844_008481 [Phrynosoma platyrhinos]|uniref:Uncharacterized protein n=1 Tax=Phrynosoma platyrhinos TaxID=52577 RepID=A0ABQ7TE55_PHRPL|nr:hypothetical protein JD844_008481 [Phrynosoma platyrhinos]